MFGVDKIVDDSSEWVYPPVMVSRVAFLSNEFQIQQNKSGLEFDSHGDKDVVSISQEQAVALAYQILKLAGVIQ